MIIEEEITTDPETQPELHVDLGPTKSRRREQHDSVLLGFFVHPTKHHHHHHHSFGNIPQEPPLFIHTSNKGKKLAEGSWGNLTESLNFFISHQFEIVASSNGFLLCRSNNPIMQYLDHYIICNPVTGQFRYIPNPCNDCLFAPLTFLSEATTNVSSLDKVHHHIVIAQAQKHTHLAVETFCSSRNKWSQAILLVDSPFPWNLENVPGFTIDEVIFWNATFHGLAGYDSALLAYDHSLKRLGARLIVTPPRHEECRFRSKRHSDFFGPSEGNVHYARRDSDRFEIWVLEDYRSKECWIMKHRVSLNFPGFVRAWLGSVCRNGALVPEVISFHPRNSGLVFMTLGVRTFCYDVKRRKIRGNVHSFRPFGSQFFVYEWPQLATHFDD